MTCKCNAALSNAIQSNLQLSRLDSASNLKIVLSPVFEGYISKTNFWYLTTNILKMSKIENNFYNAGKEYWEKVSPTVDGMLGGFAFISAADIKGSKQFLKQLFHSKCPPGKAYALDCGAGIGRVSKFLLTDVFEKVDMVEQNPSFLEQAKSYLGEKRLERIGEFFQMGLQDFFPEKRKYDVIWIQWVLGHLTDEDLITFLKACQ